MIKLLYGLVFFCLLAGCQNQQSEQTAKDAAPSPDTAKLETTTAKTPSQPPAPPKTLFNEPIQPVKVELPSQALPYWRDAAGGSRPALVLMSIHPFLQPLGDSQRADVSELVTSGSSEDFLNRGNLYRINPTMTNSQTLSAALDSNLFSRIIWVFPSRTTPAELKLETFRQQMLEAGFINESEGEALQLNDGIFSGTVRGTPFLAIHPQALTTIEGPVIVHLDLGYFKGLYNNEVRTPLYPTLQQTVAFLQPLKWMARSVTLSYSTEEREMSLETRFLINRFAELLEHPEMIDQDLPAAWDLHSEALYTINFFLETKVTELYNRAVQAAPEDSAVLYGLALRVLRDGNLNEALKLIERAAASDNGYALEYFNLSERAYESGDYATALKLIEKGRPHFPRNPFIDIQRAQILLDLGRLDEAHGLLRELKKRPWSAQAHPQIMQHLDNLLAWQPEENPAPKAHKGEQ